MPAPYQIRSYSDSEFRNLTHYAEEFEWDSNTSLIRDLAFNVSSQAFDNATDFPYLYFTSGITDAINVIIPKKKTTILPLEYRYLNLFQSVTLKESGRTYMSYPFSGNGKFLDIPTEQDVILDCAYIFASNMSNVKVIPSNVSKVLFGLSKSHNLPDYRIGWILSKEKIPEFHALQYEYNYAINGNIKEALTSVLMHQPNFLYNKYKQLFSEMYQSNGVTEGDTNLFGVKDGIKVPWYILNSTT